jgi:hypothetical protein
VLRLLALEFLFDVLCHCVNFPYRRLQFVPRASEFVGPVFEFIIFVDIYPFGILRPDFAFVVTMPKRLSLQTAVYCNERTTSKVGPHQSRTSWTSPIFDTLVRGLPTESPSGKANAAN